jgi:o-succinylbenzoate---CoA ligase
MGCLLYTGWTGMTEACSSLTFMALNKPKLQEPKNQAEASYLGGVCVGKPAPHVEIQIGVDGNDNSCSQTGNVLTRGLHTMVGYWVNDRVVGLSDSVRNGWLDTGDTGWMDKSGNLWLVGRQKGRIKSGGENVYPEEVLTPHLILKPICCCFQ